MNGHMIITGEGSSRKIVVYDENICFILFKNSENTLTIWTEALTPKDGQGLTKAYRNNTFAKVWDKLFEDKQRKGCSELGKYTLKEFHKLLCEYTNEEYGEFAKLLYESLMKRTFEGATTLSRAN